MTNDDIQSAVTKAIQPLMEIVEIMKHKSELREVQIDATLGLVRIIKDQQSVMNKKIEDMQKSIKVLQTSSEKHTNILDQIEKDHEEMKESLNANTASVMEMEATFKGYGDMYKINADNILNSKKELRKRKKT